MKSSNLHRIRLPRVSLVGTGWLASALCLAGCEAPDWQRNYQPPPNPPPLGTISDQFWTSQEVNAEASKNVFYQHEFKRDSVRLNWAGEDHLKQVAAQMKRWPDFPVVVEQSLTAKDPEAKYQYPVNPDPELDNRRRELIVRGLAALGVSDADQRVVVSTAYTEGITGQQAERAYLRGGITTGVGGFGGGFGGFGGFGGGGGVF